MQGSDASGDDLSTLMPKSVQGLNASISTEREVHALNEYLEVQKQKTQQSALVANVTQEVFLPVYNRRRDRLASRRQGSGRPTTARSFGFTGRKTADHPTQGSAVDGEDTESIFSSKKEQAPPGKAPRPAADENAPPLELLGPVSKQRKTEREERKRKGTGRTTSRRSFGLDLKQLPRRQDETDSECEWAQREGQLEAHRKQRQGGMKPEAGGEERRGSLAGRRKSVSRDKFPSRKSLVPGGLETGSELNHNEVQENGGQVPTAEVDKNAEAVGGVNEHGDDVNDHFEPGVLLPDVVQETMGADKSSEGTMTDEGMDMEIDGSDEEVDGPVNEPEAVRDAPPVAARWTFNPLFAGPDTVEKPQAVKPPQVLATEAPQTSPPPEVTQTSPPPEVTQTAPPLEVTQTDPPAQPLSPNRRKLSIPPPAAPETSPPRSQAESNAVRDTSASQGVEKSLSLDTHNRETGAAAALAGMSLEGGLRIPAPGTPPPEEEIDFPALEGSPPPVTREESSEAGVNDGQNEEHPLALTVADRKETRPTEVVRRPTKKNKRLMLLHGRKSLADAGLRTEQGVRRTTRPRVRPLEWWRNETVVYERSHDSLPTIARVITLSPDPGWPRPEGRAAIRLRQQKLEELTQAEEVLALSVR